MLFHVDPHNGLAIYDQIVRHVKFAVADGALKPGEMVPSVRQLARELAINPNTIARAYRCLQDDKVLEAVRGTGLEVAGGAAGPLPGRTPEADPRSAAASACRGQAKRTRSARTARNCRQRAGAIEVGPANEEGSNP